MPAVLQAVFTSSIGSSPRPSIKATRPGVILEEALALRWGISRCKGLSPFRARGLIDFFVPIAASQRYRAALMAKGREYKFCFGPWNLSEGQDPYGPPTRPPQTFDWKLEQLKNLGFDAMMLHDDDAVPDVDSKSSAEIRKEARELKKKLDDSGVAAEMVAPRLWFSRMTI